MRVLDLGIQSPTQPKFVQLTHKEFGMLIPVYPRSLLMIKNRSPLTNRHKELVTFLQRSLDKEKFRRGPIIVEESTEIYNYRLKKEDKTLKRRATLDEFWMQTHAKKGSRPLDRLAGNGGSVGDDLGEAGDVEENIHEHNVNWVDMRAGETINKYKECVVERYGEDNTLHPELDVELWSETSGGKKKGRLYGTGNTSDPYVVLTGTPSMPSSDPPGRSDEVQRLKEQIAELERDKAEKNAMMEKIEENARLYAEMSEKLQMLSQNLPQNIPSS